MSTNNSAVFNSIALGSGFSDKNGVHYTLASSGSGVYTYNSDINPQYTIGVDAFNPNFNTNFQNLVNFTGQNTVTIIGANAFSGCYALSNINIGNSVINIDNDAFNNCTALTNVTIPDSVTNIGDQAFLYCIGLTNITIGNRVTNIGSQSFYLCVGLKNVTIPDSVTNIGSQSFYNCSGLTNVTIGNNVANIGNLTFFNCTALTNVTIGNSVTSIGNYAFSQCQALPSITIGNSVTTIGIRAFYNCQSLTNVYFTSTTCPSLGGSVFYGDNSTAYVPTGFDNIPGLYTNGVTNVVTGAEPPSAPGNVQAVTYQYGNATVTWSQPESITPIIKYTITSIPSTSTIIVNNTTTTANFSGLKNGTT